MSSTVDNVFFLNLTFTVLNKVPRIESKEFRTQIYEGSNKTARVTTSNGITAQNTNSIRFPPYASGQLSCHLVPNSSVSIACPLAKNVSRSSISASSYLISCTGSADFCLNTKYGLTAI